MKVILFGATGMVGQGVLRECLLDADVERVLAVGRSATGSSTRSCASSSTPISPTTRASRATRRATTPASSASASRRPGMTEADYRRVTYDLTLAAARSAGRAQPGDDVRLRLGRGHRQHRAAAA